MASKKQRPLNDTRRALTSVFTAKSATSSSWTRWSTPTSGRCACRRPLCQMGRPSLRVWNVMLQNGTPSRKSSCTCASRTTIPTRHPLCASCPRGCLPHGSRDSRWQPVHPILTMEGWDPSMTEALVLALHNLLIDGDGAIDLSVSYGYSEAEAGSVRARCARPQLDRRKVGVVVMSTVALGRCTRGVTTRNSLRKRMTHRTFTDYDLPPPTPSDLHTAHARPRPRHPAHVAASSPHTRLRRSSPPTHGSRRGLVPAHIQAFAPHRPVSGRSV